MRLAAVAVMLMIVATTGQAGAWKTRSWPTIFDVSQCVVHPGESMVMNFTFKNRLNFHLDDAVLEIDVYMRLTDDDANLIHTVQSPPTLKPLTSTEYVGVPGVVNQYIFDDLRSKECVNIRFRVDTSEDTRIGVYVLRLRLQFTKDGEQWEFWSRGHFTEDEYKDALNLTFPEGVGGTLPETSFEVMSRSPDNVGYIFLVGAVACFGAGTFFWWKKR